MPAEENKPAVIVLEQGVVGSLDYKIIEANRADALFAWLKANKYSYSGDEATLNFYVQKKWVFTVMKIDTMQMKKNKDGSYAGEVTPTRFQFASDKLVYPLKITQISVKDKTGSTVLCAGAAQGRFAGRPELSISVGADVASGQWLHSWRLAGQWRQLAQGYRATNSANPQARPGTYALLSSPVGGRNPTSRAALPPLWNGWRKLNAADIKVLCGEMPYSEKLPNVDEGFTQADVNDMKRSQAVIKVIQARLNKRTRNGPSVTSSAMPRPRMFGNSSS